jgi:microcystin-dependent protein
MSKHAWLTPDEPESMAFTCVKVYYPETDAFRAALRGALLLLEKADNWEQLGDMTPDDAAQYWQTANNLSMGFDSCSEGGDVPGTIIWGGWSNAPSGYLLCDGSALDTTEYADLFGAIGYTFGGSGDSFNIPDMRDYFAAGAGSTYALGDSGGSDTHTLTVDEMPSHDHTTQPMDLRGRATGSLLSWTYQQGDQGVTGNTGGGMPHENRPPFLALNAAIKY